ncbi:MAG: GDSL-type esterase/lipase family protein [Candidatus Omnitrophota bacterium]
MRFQLKIIFIIIWVIFIFLMLEWTSYIILPVAKFNLLEAIQTICYEDQVLFWKQRKNLNTIFQGKKLKTNSLGLRNAEIIDPKPQETLRIICLGASSTFGWGVGQESMYSKKLEELLNAKGINAEVINAGVIGYTTFQGKEMFKKELFKYKPDLITIAYILNDVDRYRFFRNEGLSDSELELAPSKFIIIKNMFYRSRSCFILKRLISKVLQKNKKAITALYKKRFYLSKIRVSPDEYQNNLEQLIFLAKEKEIKVLLVKMPVNLDTPVLTARERKIIKSGKNLSKYCFHLAVQNENQQRLDKALLLYKKALDYQVFDCLNDAAKYHNILEKLALQHNVSLVDVVQAFTEQVDNTSLFNYPNDVIHLSAKGHEVIAGEIFRIIEKDKLLMHLM